MTWLLTSSLLLPMLGTAVETKPVPVLRVIDGNTIEVQADLGGQPYPVRVRLAYVDVPPAVTPDDDLALRFLRISLPVGSLVALSDQGDGFRHDADGRLLALIEKADLPQTTVVGQTTVHPDGSSSTPMRIVNPRIPLQFKLIESGYAVYSRRLGDAGELWHEALVESQKNASEAKVGSWATGPQWMQEKADERLAPNP